VGPDVPRASPRPPGPLRRPIVHAQGA
jgi:hypothetical protein